MATKTSDSLQSVLVQLISVYEHVAKKRALCEEICQDCRLLLKPWPKNVYCLNNEGSEKKKIERVTLAPSEVEELKRVDKVLAKAEKVRQTMQIKKPEVVKVKTESSDSSDSIVKAVKQSKAVKSPSEVDGRRLAPLDSKQGNVKQPEQKGLVRKMSSTETKNKPLSQDQQRVIRYKPVHQTAPFKTLGLPQGRLRVPPSKSKIKSVVNAKTSQPSNSEDQLCNCGDNTQFNKLVGNESLTPVDSVDSLGSVGSLGSDLCSESQSDDQVNIASLTDLHLSSESNCESDFFDEGSATVQICKQAPSTGELFTLRTQGSKLKLSSDFSRLLSMNSNLRQKVQTAMKSSMRRKLREGESSADNFIAQLNADISAQCSRALFEKLTVLNSYCQTYDWLNSLLAIFVENIDILESCDWRRILQTKATLEFVLHEFAEMETYFGLLCNNLSLSCQKLESNCCKTPTTLDTINLPPSYWLTKNLATRHELLGLSPIVRYQNTQQLARYTAALHQVQLLLLQLNLLTETAECCISLLEQTEPNDASFKSLFRATFSLLTSSGQHFPVIINDSILDS